MSDVLRPPKLQAVPIDSWPYGYHLEDTMGTRYATLTGVNDRCAAYMLQAVNDYGACIDALSNMITIAGASSDVGSTTAAAIQSQAGRLIQRYRSLG